MSTTNKFTEFDGDRKKFFIFEQELLQSLELNKLSYLLDAAKVIRIETLPVRPNAPVVAPNSTKEEKAIALKDYESRLRIFESKSQDHIKEMRILEKDQDKYVALLKQHLIPSIRIRLNQFFEKTNLPASERLITARNYLKKQFGAINADDIYAIMQDLRKLTVASCKGYLNLFGFHDIAMAEIAAIPERHPTTQEPIIDAVTGIAKFCEINMTELKSILLSQMDDRNDMIASLKAVYGAKGPLLTYQTIRDELLELSKNTSIDLCSISNRYASHSSVQQQVSNAMNINVLPSSTNSYLNNNNVNSISKSKYSNNNNRSSSINNNNNFDNSSQQCDNCGGPHYVKSCPECKCFTCNELFNSPRERGSHFYRVHRLQQSSIPSVLGKNKFNANSASSSQQVLGSNKKANNNNTSNNKPQKQKTSFSVTNNNNNNMLPRQGTVYNNNNNSSSAFSFLEEEDEEENLDD